jgi:hypothetical protein
MTRYRLYYTLDSAHWLDSLPLTRVLHDTVESCEAEFRTHALFGTDRPVWIEDTGRFGASEFFFCVDDSMKTSPQGTCHFVRERFVQGEAAYRSFISAFEQRAALMWQKTLTDEQDRRFLEIMYETSKLEHWNPVRLCKK